MTTNSNEQKEIVINSLDRTLNKLRSNTHDNYPTLYISGPMTGIDKHNFPKFNALAKHFRELNYYVFNPAENFDGITGLPYEVHFLEDVLQVAFCTHIYMMEDWGKSRGAYCEYLLARRLNLIFVDKSGLRIDPPDAPEIVLTKENINVTVQSEIRKAFQRLKLLTTKTDIAFKEIADYINKEATIENIQDWLERGVFEKPKGNELDVFSNLRSSLVEEEVEKTDNKFMNEIAVNSIKSPNFFKKEDLIEVINCLIRQRDKAEQQLAVAEDDIKKLNNVIIDFNNPVTIKSVESVAEIAQKLVHGERRADYNHPYYNFKQTGDLWTALGFTYKGQPVEPENVAEAMVLVKMSRESYKHKDDNLVDEVGYILCHELVLDKKKQITLEQIALTNEHKNIIYDEYEEIDPQGGIS